MTGQTPNITEWCTDCPDCHTREPRRINDPCGRLHTECRYCNEQRVLVALGVTTPNQNPGAGPAHDSTRPPTLYEVRLMIRDQDQAGFDEWLATERRETAAKAWDEAHHAVYVFEGERYAYLNHGVGERPVVPTNPYRIGAGG